MNKAILAIDPSGTGTTGIYFTDGINKEFKEYKNICWKKHYQFIVSTIESYKPKLLLFETTNFIIRRNKDSLGLIKLLGALECINIENIEGINVIKVKELTKSLFSGKLKINDLKYLPGRGKGWFWKNEKISVHQLEAYLVWYLFNEKRKLTKIL